MTCAEKVARGMARSMAKNDAKHKAGQTLPKGVDVEEYVYIDDGDNMHKLNVYRPSNIKNTLPLIIDIHGGAWVYGDKELNKGMCMYYASLGYCVAGMSYRLVPDVKPSIRCGIFSQVCILSQKTPQYGARTRQKSCLRVIPQADICHRWRYVYVFQKSCRGYTA